MCEILQSTVINNIMPDYKYNFKLKVFKIFCSDPPPPHHFIKVVKDIL